MEPPRKRQRILEPEQVLTLQNINGREDHIDELDDGQFGEGCGLKKAERQLDGAESEEEDDDCDEGGEDDEHDEHNENPNDTLEQDRARLEHKLKSKFEAIFEKYGRDFSGVGDEIDLRTGRIVVNNGHLVDMQDERDTGTIETSRKILRAFSEDLDDELAPEETKPPECVGGARNTNMLDLGPNPTSESSITTPNVSIGLQISKQPTQIAPPESTVSAKPISDKQRPIPSEADILAQFGDQLGQQIVKYVTQQQIVDEPSIEPAWRTPVIDILPPRSHPLAKSIMLETGQESERSASPEAAISIWALDASEQLKFQTRLGSSAVRSNRRKPRSSDIATPSRHAKREPGEEVVIGKSQKQKSAVADKSLVPGGVSSVPGAADGLGQTTNKTRFSKGDDKVLLDFVRDIRRQKVQSLWAQEHWQNLEAKHPRHSHISYKERYSKHYFLTGKHYLTDPDNEKSKSDADLKDSNTVKNMSSEPKLSKGSSQRSGSDLAVHKGPQSCPSRSGSRLKRPSKEFASSPLHSKTRSSRATPAELLSTSRAHRRVGSLSSGRRVSQRISRIVALTDAANQLGDVDSTLHADQSMNETSTTKHVNRLRTRLQIPSSRKPKPPVLKTLQGVQNQAEKPRTAIAVADLEPEFGTQQSRSIGRTTRKKSSPKLPRIIPDSQPQSPDRTISSPLKSRPRPERNIAVKKVAENFSRNRIDPSYEFSDDDEGKRPIPIQASSHEAEKRKYTAVASTQGALEEKPLDEVTGVEKSTPSSDKHLHALRPRRSFPILPRRQSSSSRGCPSMIQNPQLDTKPLLTPKIVATEAKTPKIKSDMWLQMVSTEDIDELSMAPDQLLLLNSLTCNSKAFSAPRALPIRPKSETKPRRLVEISRKFSTPKSARTYKIYKRTPELSPTRTLFETPGGSMRRCGESGFRCEKDFCFSCA